MKKSELINKKHSPIQGGYIEKYVTEEGMNLTAATDGVSTYAGAYFMVIVALTNVDPYDSLLDDVENRFLREICFGGIEEVTSLYYRSVASRPSIKIK